MWNYSIEIDAQFGYENAYVEHLPIREIDGTHYIQLPPANELKEKAIQQFYTKFGFDDTRGIEVIEFHLLGSSSGGEYDDYNIHIRVGLHIVSPHKYIGYKKSNEAEGFVYVYNDRPMTFTTVKADAQTFDLIDLITLLGEHTSNVRIEKIA